MRPNYLILAITVVALLACSCKKQKNISPSAQSANLQLDSIVNYLKANVLNTTEHFYYDADHYVVKIVRTDYDNTENNKVTMAGVDSFIYNAAHQLVSWYGYDLGKAPTGRNEFIYDASGRMIRENVMWFPPDIEHYEEFIYYPGNQPATITDHAPNGDLGWIVQFSYIDDNLAYRKDSSIASHRSYATTFDTYDDQHSYAGLLKGMNAATYDHPALYSANNCTKQTSTNSQGSDYVNYEYNAEGYPTKAYGTDTVQKSFTRYYYSHY